MNYSFLDFLGQIYQMQKQLDGEVNKKEILPLNTTNIAEQSSWNILLQSPLHEESDPQIQKENQKTQILQDINIGGQSKIDENSNRQQFSLYNEATKYQSKYQSKVSQEIKKPDKLSDQAQSAMQTKRKLVYHPNKILICRICKKGFSHNYSLRKHLKNLHNVVEHQDMINNLK